MTPPAQAAAIFLGDDPCSQPAPWPPATGQGGHRTTSEKIMREIMEIGAVAAAASLPSQERKEVGMPTTYGYGPWWQKWWHRLRLTYMARRRRP